MAQLATPTRLAHDAARAGLRVTRGRAWQLKMPWRRLNMAHLQGIYSAFLSLNQLLKYNLQGFIAPELIPA